MTLIEGVGDEVTDFFIVLSILLVGWLAWCSTNITDQPLIRTVLVLQHRTRMRIAELRANQHIAGIATQPPNLETTEEESAEINSTGNNDASSSCSESSTANDANGLCSGNDISPEVAASRPASEETLMQAMDSNGEDSASLQKIVKVDTSNKTNKSEPPAVVDTNTNATAEESANDAAEISIKLKFINDDQKVVTGSLKEMLGDFKRRHFQIELESQKLVRLIFNGQVLQPDSQTLEHCGLYNNCVVHCLVHQPRPASVQPPPSSTMDNSSSIYFNPQSFQDIPAGAGISSVHNEWDLSRLLVSILTLILGIAWYSRYHYAQLFTATTTLALYALTAMFTVSLFSNFFPDQDGIRNVE